MVCCLLLHAAERIQLCGVLLGQVRIASLKREEEGLQKERDRLETEKMRHVRCEHGA